MEVRIQKCTHFLLEILHDPTVSAVQRHPNLKRFLRLAIPELKRTRHNLSSLLSFKSGELCISHHILKHHPNVPKVIGAAFREKDFQAVRPAAHDCTMVLVDACGTLTT